MPDNMLVQAMGIAAPSAPVLDPNKLKSLAVVGLLGLGVAGALSACVNPNGTEMTPAQKFTAACDEYYAGNAALGPLIQTVVAKQGATAAKAYQAAQIVLNDACVKNPDGSYLNASNPTNLATLLPQVLAAAGQLAVLFIPSA
ncbi:MAG TPA: hypothetical protein VMB81_26250 [Candidatus Sulfotelmatobacter sp.]|nr:hypothetical protein [Candidatus Sulfotelmatobacter sp.]